MTAITPGDEVTVTITGTTVDHDESDWAIETPSGHVWALETNDPDVKVTVLRSERPTRREVLEKHHGWFLNILDQPNCYCGERVADVVGGNKGWSQHLDAVLTKWEES